MMAIGTENSGNFAWADTMCRILNTNVKREKNFILSKAKKDTDVKIKGKQKIEIVDEGGIILQEKKPDEEREAKSYKQKRLEMIERQKQKAAWENMCRVKPDITNKDKERELVRIATRGVVHLFDIVEKKKKRQNLGMDILKGHPKKQISEVTPPFKPQVTSDTDTRYFDQEFTGESVELTPPDQGPLNSITEEIEQPYFQQFSFHGSTGTLGRSIDQ